MRFVLLSLFIIAFQWSSIAQNLDIQIKAGPVFSVGEKSIPVDIVNYDSSGYYIMYGDGKYGNGETSLVKFNNDLKPTDQRFHIYSKKDDYTSLGLLHVKNSVFQLLGKSTYDSRQYFLQKIDAEKFSAGIPKMIAEVPSEERSIDNSVKTFFLSHDESELLFFYSVPNKGRDNQKFRILTFDHDFVQTSSVDYELPFKNKLFTVYSIRLLENNDLILLGKHDLKPLEGDMLKHYEYWVYKLGGGKTKRLFNIQTENRHLRQIRLSINKLGEIVIAGFYSENDMYAIKGTFYQRSDTIAGRTLVKNIQEFDISFHAEIIKEKRRQKEITRMEKNGKPEARYYVLNNFVMDSLENITLVAEQTLYSNYQWHYLNIAIVKISPNGEIIWAKQIGKNNSYPGPGLYSSYKLIPHNNELIFVYNGSSENKNHTNGKAQNPYYYPQTTTLFSTTVDSNGNYNRNIVLSTEELGGYSILPSCSMNIGNGSWLFFMQDPGSKKDQRLIKFNFP